MAIEKGGRREPASFFRSSSPGLARSARLRHLAICAIVRRMLGKAMVILGLSLSCVGSTAVPDPVPPSAERRQRIAWGATQRDDEFAGLIRSSVYSACGSDRVLRCQQFAPRSYRSIPPIVPIRSMKCLETVYPRGFRTCEFVLGTARRHIRCTIEFRERIGIHNPYWSDEIATDARPVSYKNDDMTAVSYGRSSLKCDGPLLPLTAEPPPVDPAPATPPMLRELRQDLITPDDYYMIDLAPSDTGITLMKLRVGSHGRIDRCTTIRSSGSRTVDERACHLVYARAHFQPATDARGRQVTAETLYRHDWRAMPQRTHIDNMSALSGV